MKLIAAMAAIVGGITLVVYLIGGWTAVGVEWIVWLTGASFVVWLHRRYRH